MTDKRLAPFAEPKGDAGAVDTTLDLQRTSLPAIAARDPGLAKTGPKITADYAAFSRAGMGKLSRNMYRPLQCSTSGNGYAQQLNEAALLWRWSRSMAAG